MLYLQQETLLRVCEGRPQLQGNHHDDELLSSSAAIEVVGCGDFRKPLTSSVERVPGLTAEDDDTLSTASMSSDEESSFDRRVSFSEDLVTEVWTRPLTLKEDVPSLFYSCEDTSR